MTLDRIQNALEGLIKAASEALGGDRTGLMDAIMAARSAAREPLAVKPLSWRTIDEGRAYVASGHGFTGQVNRLHTGKWEAAWNAGRMDFSEEAAARYHLEAVYAAAIWSCLI